MPDKLVDDIRRAESSGWLPVEHWPQTFWKRNKTGHIDIFTVYVDDFVMAGENHMSEWAAIESQINI